MFINHKNSNCFGIIEYIKIIVFICFFCGSVSAMATYFDIHRDEYVASLENLIRANATFQQVLRRAAHHRQNAAIQDITDNMDEATAFGTQRTEETVTPLGDYPLMRLLFMDNIETRYFRSTVIAAQNNFTLVNMPSECRDVLANHTNGILYNFIVPRPLNITGSKGGMCAIIDRVANTRYLVAYGAHIMHTAPNEIPAFLNRAAIIFGNLINNNNNNNNIPQITRLLGELHYLITVASPFNRGSAAIAEMIVEAIAHALGLEITYPNNIQVQNVFQTILNRSGNAIQVNPQDLQGGREIVDQMAHVLRLEDFLDYYQRLITISLRTLPQLKPIILPARTA